MLPHAHPLLTPQTFHQQTQKQHHRFHYNTANHHNLLQKLHHGQYLDPILQFSPKYLVLSNLPMPMIIVARLKLHWQKSIQTTYYGLMTVFWTVVMVVRHVSHTVHILTPTKKQHLSYNLTLCIYKPGGRLCSPVDTEIGGIDSAIDNMLTNRSSYEHNSE